MKKFILFLLPCLIAYNLYAQDAHLSQFYESNIIRNPALTGIFSGDYKFNIQYRNQWSSVSIPFQTMLLSAETKKSISRDGGDFVSFGLLTSIDKAGTISLSNTQLYATINYNKLLEETHFTYLSIGFAGGFIQRSFNSGKVILDNQYQNGNISPIIGEGLSNTSLSHFDLGSGISINGALGYQNKANYYIGVGVYHINRPDETFRNESFVKLNRKWSVHGGFKSNLGNNLSFTILSNYTYQNPFSECIIGGFLNFKPINSIHNKNFVVVSLGAFNRIQDAYIGVIKLDFKKYAVGISYDATHSTLQNYNNSFGGLELSFNIRGFYKTPTINTLMRCPRFEDVFEPDAY